MNDLAPLREAIADVDRALLELLHRRMELAAEVGKIKAARGQPVVVRDAEDRVLTRARQHAEACGVSEDVMAEIFQAIIRGSVERQHRVGVTRRVEQGGRVLVLGGAGALGGWLVRFFSLVGHQVAIADPAIGRLPEASDRFATLADVPDLDAFDAIVVAVPLSLTAEVLDQLTVRRPTGLVVEVASIKAHLATALDRARAAGLRPLALHPMFGPGKSLYDPLTFVLACQDDPDGERARLEPLLRHPYTRVVAIPFEHHDRLMGWLLGLAHLTGMVFGTALSHSGLAPDEFQTCASTTFLRQAATARSVLSEDPDLYFDIQRLNPHRAEIYEATRQAIAQLAALVEAGDREAFRETLARGRRAVGDQS